jgi:hypothetical protein
MLCLAVIQSIYFGRNLSSFSQGDQNDVAQAASQFKSGYGVIIGVAYQQPNHAPITGFCSMTSPGMCIPIDANGNTEQAIPSIIQALCSGIFTREYQ